VDDSAPALLDHAREDGPVQPDGRQQIRAEGLHPVVIGERERAARSGKGCSDAVHDDIEPAKDLDCLAGDEARAFG